MGNLKTKVTAALDTLLPKMTGFHSGGFTKGDRRDRSGPVAWPSPTKIKDTAFARTSAINITNRIPPRLPDTVDLKTHLTRQMVFSKATFGPGARTRGVTEHIRQEITEVRDSVGHVSHAEEWADVVILGLDGLTRAIWAGSDYQMSADEAAAMAVRTILAKQQKNEKRDWPDWRKFSEDQPINHVRESANPTQSLHDALRAAEGSV